MKTTLLTKVAAFAAVFVAMSVQGALAQDVDTSKKIQKLPHFASGVSEISYSTGWQISASDRPAYHLAPQVVSYHYQLDDVGLEGWRRGNVEWITSGFFVPVLKGPENRFAGLVFGPRYNFVQEGWKFIPYIGSQVGVAFTDSTDTVVGAQGQDFCFSFQIAAGTRYIINEHWSIAAGAMYQHFSNGGLSEPARENNGLDGVGPQVSVLYKF